MVTFSSVNGTAIPSPALSPEMHPLNSESGHAFVSQMKTSVGEEEWRRGIKEERIDWAERIACAKANRGHNTDDIWESQMSSLLEHGYELQIK